MNRSAVSVRAIEIAARQTGAADVELAGNADRHGLQPIVEHVDARVRDGPADRHARSPLSGLALPERRGDRRFGRPVAVVQIGIEAGEEALDELDGQRFGARRHAPQTRARARVLVEERAQQRRDEADSGDASLGDERCRMRRFAASHHDHGCADAEGLEELPHRVVERERRGLQQPIARGHPEVVVAPVQVVAHRAVGHDDALGPARRARGVNDISGVAGRDTARRRARALRIDGPAHVVDLDDSRARAIEASRPARVASRRSSRPRRRP